MITRTLIDEAYKRKMMLVVSVDMAGLDLSKLHHSAFAEIAAIDSRKRWVNENLRNMKIRADAGDRYYYDRYVGKVLQYNRNNVDSIDDLRRYLPSIDVRVSWEEVPMPELVVKPKQESLFPPKSYFTTAGSTASTASFTFKIEDFQGVWNQVNAAGGNPAGVGVGMGEAFVEGFYNGINAEAGIGNGLNVPEGDDADGEG